MVTASAWARPFQCGAFLLLGLGGKSETIASHAQATLAPGGKPGSSEANGNADPVTAALLQAAMSKLTLSNHPTSFGELVPFDCSPEQSKRLEVGFFPSRGAYRSLCSFSCDSHGLIITHSEMTGCKHFLTMKGQQLVPPLVAFILTQNLCCLKLSNGGLSLPEQAWNVSLAVRG